MGKLLAFFSIIVIFLWGCSTYEVDLPEDESEYVLNALFKPGEPLHLFVGRTGTVNVIADTIPILRSVLYENRTIVDTFLYKSNIEIMEDKEYRLEVYLPDGVVLSGTCLTSNLFEIKLISEKKMEGRYYYSVLLKGLSAEDKNICLLFNPIQYDTVFFDLSDSSRYRVYENDWMPDLPIIMNSKYYFTIPGNFSDTLLFTSVDKGIVKLAEVSPILYKAMEQTDYFREGDKIPPVSLTNVSSGTGILSLYNLKAARP